MYKKPKMRFGIVMVAPFLGAFIGLFLDSPVGILIGVFLGVLVALGDVGKTFSEDTKQYEETQKLVMQKIQMGVPLSSDEQGLWNTMNQNINAQ